MLDQSHKDNVETSISLNPIVNSSIHQSDLIELSTANTRVSAQMATQEPPKHIRFASEARVQTMSRVTRHTPIPEQEKGAR